MWTQRIILALVLINSVVAGASMWMNLQQNKTIASLASGGGSASSDASGSAASTAGEAAEYQFFPIEKIIVSLQDEKREHYFVVDLVLQAEVDTNKKKLQQVDPMVRNSVVTHMTGYKFSQLRSMAIADLQSELETAILADFSARGVVQPFAHVLVSKLVVQ